jgi:hypothetical protein
MRQNASLGRPRTAPRGGRGAEAADAAAEPHTETAGDVVMVATLRPALVPPERAGEAVGPEPGAEQASLHLQPDAPLLEADSPTPDAEPPGPDSLPTEDRSARDESGSGVDITPRPSEVRPTPAMHGHGWGPLASLGCVALSLACAVVSGVFAWDAGRERRAALAAQHASEAPVPAPPAPALPAAPLLHPEIAARLDTLTERQDLAATVLAALTLEDVAASSAPFAGELAYAMSAVRNDPALLAPLDRLMHWAEDGVPSRTELLARFPRAAAEARAAALADRSGFADRATLFMRNVALRVGIGELPARDPAAMLDRARGALADGRLAVALAQLAALSPAATQAIDGWMRGAAARVEVEAALGEFRQLAIVRALR